jgi:hypothetical protein
MLPRSKFPLSSRPDSSDSIPNSVGIDPKKPFSIEPQVIQIGKQAQLRWDFTAEKVVVQIQL